MQSAKLLGIYEISQLAGVNPSAVANWRRRFKDFPAPVAELKSGPVFHEIQIRAWLKKRDGDELTGSLGFYDQLAAKRGDSPSLIANTGDAPKVRGSKYVHQKTGSTAREGSKWKDSRFFGIYSRRF